MNFWVPTGKNGYSSATGPAPAGEGDGGLAAVATPPSGRPQWMQVTAESEMLRPQSGQVTSAIDPPGSPALNLPAAVPPARLHQGSVKSSVTRIIE